MEMGQELNKTWGWEWESARMGMTPISMGIDSHQRLWYIVTEYSNTRLIQYLRAKTVNSDDTCLSPFSIMFSLTEHERMKQNRHNSDIAVFSRLGFFT